MLVKCGPECHVNPALIASIHWDRGHTYTNLVVTLADAREIRIPHNPHHLGGNDCYAIERELIAASANPA
ncbi:hypothetical protein [Novosphingobium sp. YAF33]|uniref:hypothetical protein n=1 Tax=Novosphingobium sp. YAF33 TaxID=3233082 RepID=UPI003F99914A